MVALKDILLQVLLAGSAVVLIPLFYLGLSKQQVIRHNHIDKVNYSFTVTSVLSMLLCLLFALSESTETLPVSLSIIPVTLAVLYCNPV